MKPTKSVLAVLLVVGLALPCLVTTGLGLEEATMAWPDGETDVIVGGTDSGESSAREPHTAIAPSPRGLRLLLLLRDTLKIVWIP